MTAWRPAPIRRDEVFREKTGQEVNTKNAAGSIDSSEPATVSVAQPRSFAGKIKDLFRDAVKVLTGKTQAPEPKTPRKRTTGETGRGFLKVARKLMRHVHRRPAIQTLGLHEPELWQWNNPDCTYALAEELHPVEANFLSPQL